jgi:DDE domain
MSLSSESMSSAASSTSAAPCGGRPSTPGACQPRRSGGVRFTPALDAARRPTEVTTDRTPAYPRVLDELVPEAWHVVEQYANNPIEPDHGRLKTEHDRCAA